MPSLFPTETQNIFGFHTSSHKITINSRIVLPSDEQSAQGFKILFMIIDLFFYLCINSDIMRVKKNNHHHFSPYE